MFTLREQIKNVNIYQSPQKGNKVIYIFRYFLFYKILFFVFSILTQQFHGKASTTPTPLGQTHRKNPGLHQKHSYIEKSCYWQLSIQVVFDALVRVIHCH